MRLGKLGESCGSWLCLLPARRFPVILLFFVLVFVLIWVKSAFLKRLGIETQSEDLAESSENVLVGQPVPLGSVRMS